MEMCGLLWALDGEKDFKSIVVKGSSSDVGYSAVPA